MTRILISRIFIGVNPRRFFSSSPSSSASSSPTTTTASVVPPLVSSSWLVSNLSKVRLIDCSWYMPAEKRNTHSEYESLRIPGAVFFDLDKISDPHTTLPHMLPPLSLFQSLFTNPNKLFPSDHIVLYDSKGIFSSPRGLFTMMAFGGDRVSVLDGGLPGWIAKDYPVARGPPSTRQKYRSYNNAVNNNNDNNATNNNWILQPSLIRDMHTMRSIISNYSLSPSSPSPYIFDARSAERFSGKAPEPRPGLPSGHIPNTINIPFNTLLKTDPNTGVTIMKSKSELESIFNKIDATLLINNRPIINTCGTGVTACIIALALKICGREGWSVYDGSWTEWASYKENPIIKSV